jgi:hypothetical protein
MLADNRLKRENDLNSQRSEYILGLKYNNIDGIVENLSQIKLINVINANHDNILEHISLDDII